MFPSKSLLYLGWVTYIYNFVILISFLFVVSQTHPNVDKNLFASESFIRMKNPAKPFPLNNDVGVLKWRLRTQDDSLMPLSSK